MVTKTQQQPPHPPVEEPFERPLEEPPPLEPPVYPPEPPPEEPPPQVPPEIPPEPPPEMPPQPPQKLMKHKLRFSGWATLAIYLACTAKQPVRRGTLDPQEAAAKCLFRPTSGLLGLDLASTHNPLVVGSSPTGPTITNNNLRC
jgi:hypothetical protein